MDNERAETIGDVKSELGSSGYFCMGFSAVQAT